MEMVVGKLKPVSWNVNSLGNRSMTDVRSYVLNSAVDTGTAGTRELGW